MTTSPRIKRVQQRIREQERQLDREQRQINIRQQRMHDAIRRGGNFRFWV